jgi:hypothetical protein
MLGLNGGLMGVRKVPTTGTATGVWDQNEQSVAKRANIWPVAAGSDVPVGSIAYSQSSVYSGTSAATNGPMTDGLQTGTQAATNGAVGEWIKMDLGATYTVDRVIIGNTSSTVPPGGWGSSYTNNLDLQYSLDNSNWTTIVNTGDKSAFTFLYTLSFSAVSAQYIRLFNGGPGYVALTEFYALAPSQTYP